MNSLELPILFGILILLIVLSALFSSSETGMMALNKYRLKHHAKSGNKAAIRAQKLLKSPDRLLGVILLGNNFVNIFASSIATIIAMRLMGEAGIALAAGLLTLVILIFAEVAPKTLAALYPEKIAYPAAYFLTPLLKLLSPIVWFVNFFANGFLKLFRVRLTQDHDHHELSQEELQTLIDEATGQLPSEYRSMLTSILQLESVTVEDVMIPKQEVYGVNIDQPIEGILKALQKSPYTRIPIYRGSIDDDLIGILNLRRALPALMRSDVTLKDLVKLTKPAYFVPETTSLNIQLGKFNHNKRRMALIVDEYGDIQGLLTMEDLLEEIVGKLSTDSKSKTPEAVEINEDGSWSFEAGEFVRDLNKEYNFNLPTDGPKTLNGLIQEELESLPNIGTCIRIDDYILEVVETSSNAIEKVKLIDLSRT
ncbi:MAG: HlyC/CorC family transporter [Thiomicrorhabdus chilensis]|uniref:HlyC/CorC family transporter n=1 Tax=Thiomicrorhabdus chilensis TaxID=63656 RepID=UPI00299ED834|nr:HlyC/CorC family transporter [Thiomicrorhabdus chilensis]MDX1347361.1 HlyC/CorC family transporter [Thiomicrorhabdus chilensis]